MVREKKDVQVTKKEKKEFLVAFKLRVRITQNPQHQSLKSISAQEVSKEVL